MVRIVLVAHSRALANALVEFARQMAGDDVRIDVAAGSGDDESDFGTNAEAITEAILADDTTDGVLLLVDLGSAILSAELALDLLPDDVRERVRLCPAPFVEGTLTATVQASMDASLDAVFAEAAAALDQKRTQIGEVEPTTTSEKSPSETSPSETVAPTHTRTVTLPNEHGLHARPAAQFVRTAARFDAHLQVENETTGRGPVSATSISGVATLGAVQGHVLRLMADGPEAEAALDALDALVADGFGEAPAGTNSPTAVPAAVSSSSPDAPSAAPPAEALQGIGVQEGVALGPAYVHRPALPDLPDEPPDDPAAAWDRFLAAVEEARDSLTATESGVAAAGATDAAGILDAQRLLLDDDALLDQVHERLFEAQVPVARAWMAAVDEVAEQYEALDDPYLQQRAADVRDVGRRVVIHLHGDPSAAAIDGPDNPFVLIAAELAPSDVVALPADRVQGVICAGGNPTAHSAILLRTRGLPTVFDVGQTVLSTADGTPVALDGAEGHVWIDPSDERSERLRAEQREQTERRRRRRAAAQEPAATSDGVDVTVEANVNHPLDAPAAAEAGADGVGLLRTEFLFVDRDDAPDEETQVQQIEQVAEALGGRPLTVRALDVGGDKPLRYVSQPDERNPFLGRRGIRVLLNEPQLFRTQLRAILRAAATHPLRLLLPMVATPSEVTDTQALIDTVRADLGSPAREAPLPIGIMIETPASALSAERLASHVDFFSIGTNDLTQYTKAADREHADLAALSDALHPPVLHLIHHVAAVGAAHEVPVSICGELAADVAAVPVLVGLGVHRLSVAPPSVPTVKAAVRRFAAADAEALAHAALADPDAEAVRRRADRFWKEHAPDFDA